MKKVISNSLILFAIFNVLLVGCKKKEQTIKKEEAPKALNILWIVADDLGVDLGCYGNKLIHTPNLDKLASESVLYKNLYTTTAVCSPSRSGLITGMYPVTLGVHQHRTRYKKHLPEGVEPITSYFKNAGYFVSNGKGGKKDKGGKTDYNFAAKAKDLYQGGHWSQRKEGQNFFSQVQIFYPHRPFHKDTVHPVDSDKVVLPPYYPNHEIARKDWALYLETVQAVDVKIGEIMSQLKKDGILDNTIVFFFGDQGRPHIRAKQFLYDSGTNTPLMVRFPDGKGAGTVSNKLVSNIDISVASLKIANIDIPSHIQGKDFLSDSEEREYVFTMRDRRDETVDRIRAVRSKKFKLIKNYYTDRPYTQFNAYKENSYPMLPLMRVLHKKGQLDSVQARFISNDRPAEELYDLEKDPFEINNLANNPAYSAELQKLRKVLEDWVAKNDKGTYPEAEEEIIAAQQKAKERFSNTIKKRGFKIKPTDEEMVAYWEKELN